MIKPKLKKHLTLLATLLFSCPIIAHADFFEDAALFLEGAVTFWKPHSQHRHYVTWDVPVSECGAVLDMPDTVYALVDDLTCSSNDVPLGVTQALLLSANNSKLLLNSHFIRFEYTEPGADVDLDGVVVTGNNNVIEGHGVINLFRNNIVIRNASGNRITGLILKSAAEDPVLGDRSGNGIILENASGNKVNKNKIQNSFEHGVLFVNSNDNTIVDNGIFNSSDDSISLIVDDENMTTSNNIIMHNLIEVSNNDGIDFSNSTLVNDARLLNGNTISYNEIKNVETGIEVNNGDANIVEYNKISGAHAEAINLFFADSNIVKYNTVSKTNNHGVSLGSESTNNIITHNNITLSELSGIALVSPSFTSDETSITGNEVTHNYISKSGQSGIILLADSDFIIDITNNIIINNHISKSNRQAISLLDNNQIHNVSDNVIDNNEAKHDTNASVAYSSCTLGVNAWGTNDVNDFQITGDPGCALT